MVDGETGLLLQVELNTISTSSNGLACGVSELHRSNKRRTSNSIELQSCMFGMTQHNKCKFFTDIIECVTSKSQRFPHCKHIVHHGLFVILATTL